MNRRNFLKLTGGLGLVAPLSSAMAAQPDLSEASLERLLSQLDARSTLYPTRLHISGDRMAKRAREILAEAEWRANWREQRAARRLDEFVAWLDGEFMVADGAPTAYFDEGARRIHYETIMVAAVLTREQLEDGRADDITARAALLREVRGRFELVRDVYRRRGFTLVKPRLVWRARPVFRTNGDDPNLTHYSLRLRVALPDLIDGECPCRYLCPKPEGCPALNIDLYGYLRGR